MLNNSQKLTLDSKVESTYSSLSRFSSDTQKYIGSFAALMGGLDVTGADDELAIAKEVFMLIHQILDDIEIHS